MSSLIKLRVVIDTNVFVSGVLFGGVPRRVLDIVKTSRIELLMSKILEDEILTQMRRFHVEDVTYQVIRSMIVSQAHMISPRSITSINRDPEDDMLLALSLAGNADYLITGDKDLLVMWRFESTKIVTPKEFLQRIS